MGFFRGELSSDGYQPSFMHNLLIPKIPGNKVNGLGEIETRRPSKIYHFVAKTMKFPFFLVNVYFMLGIILDRHMRPRLASSKKHNDNANRKIPPAAVKVEKTSEEWSRLVKDFGNAQGALRVGIARIDPEWIYEGEEQFGEWVIVMNVPMDYSKMTTTPSVMFHNEIVDIYGEGCRIADQVCDWLRKQGYQAKGGGLLPDELNILPAAYASGMGELGKHGSLIHPEFGSAIRFSYVCTDMPLIADEPIAFKLDDYCMSCQACTRMCPPKAISNEKQMVRGIEKWYIDFDKCLPYFNDSKACGFCLTICPFSVPDNAPKLVTKLHKRLEKRRSW